MYSCSPRRIFSLCLYIIIAAANAHLFCGWLLVISLLCSLQPSRCEGQICWRETRRERTNKFTRWMSGAVLWWVEVIHVSAGNTLWQKKKTKQEKQHREDVSERICDFYFSLHRPCVPRTRKLSFRRTKCVLLHHTIFSFFERKGRSQGLESERM